MFIKIVDLKKIKMSSETIIIKEIIKMERKEDVVSTCVTCCLRPINMYHTICILQFQFCIFSLNIKENLPTSNLKVRI